MKNIFVILLVAVCATANAQVITTMAGSSSFMLGDGGLAVKASLSSPSNVITDAHGNMYIADFSNNRIRKVDTAGIITTVAGNGQGGYSGDDGPATSAMIDVPQCVAVTKKGELYIADYGNRRVRKVDTAGIITTVAGGGGYQGTNDTVGTALYLKDPVFVLADSSDNIYFSCGDNYVRKLNKKGIVSVVAGGGGSIQDGVTARTALLNRPIALALDRVGNLYLSDAGSERIRKINTAGIITTIAGTGTVGFSGDGGPAINAKLSEPWGLSADKAGNVFFADYNNDRIRKIDIQGIITTVAGTGSRSFGGDGGDAKLASFFGPSCAYIDAKGNMLIADRGNNRVRKVAGITAGTLPLSFLNFAGALINNSIELKWQTALEQNTNIFIVERSADAVHFDSVARINAGGNSLLNTYSYTDNGFAKVTSHNIYYRIKERDNDGRGTLSKTIPITVATNTPALFVYPNPANGIVMIRRGIANETSQFAITDMAGRVIKTVNVPAGQLNTAITLYGISAGIYRLTCRSAAGVVSAPLVIK